MIEITKDNYQEAYAIIAEELPNYPLLKKMQRGFNKVNAAYMRRALEKINGQKEAPQEQAPHDPKDEQLRKLERKKSGLYTERAKCSNKFHDCQSDEERLRVSKQLEAIQGEISKVQQSIDYYRKFGELPKVVSATVYDIPEGRAECILLRQNIRVRISQYKGKLRDLARTPDDYPKRKEKIDKNQDKLNYFETYLKHVEAAI